MNSCFYGIDTPRKEELIAAVNSVEEIRRKINADSLYFLSKDGLQQSVGSVSTEYNRGLCTACFDHDYPTDVSGAIKVKHGEKILK
jgi:amidophosphoribosyltransferase